MTYTPFFNKTSAFYHQFKAHFDTVEAIFIEAEKSTQLIKGMEIEKFTDEQMALTALLARCQKLLISILKLSSEGHGEDAGILVRTLFEIYINMEYMSKYKLGSKFIGYASITLKMFYDILEKHTLDPSLLEKDDYRHWKESLDRKFNDIATIYKNKKGGITKNWSGIDLRTMSRDLDEKELTEIAETNEKDSKVFDKNELMGEKEVTYELIQKRHSIFVHCDPHGLEGFVKDEDKIIMFTDAPSSNEIELVLITSKNVFARIAILWQQSFNITPTELIEKISHVRLAYAKTS